MNGLEDSYKTFLRKLGTTEKNQLEERIAREESIETQIIEQNIRTDKEHLTIVNFCTNRFSPGSRINTKTRYVWVRVEPLYGAGFKNFDIAIYNRDPRIMILVECKSGLSDTNREINELVEKRLEREGADLAELAGRVSESLVDLILIAPAEDQAVGARGRCEVPKHGQNSLTSPGTGGG